MDPGEFHCAEPDALQGGDVEPAKPAEQDPTGASNPYGSGDATEEPKAPPFLRLAPLSLVAQHDTIATVILERFRSRLAWVALLMTAAGPGSAPAAIPDRPPNVVLVYADDLGYADLGCYGAEGFATPHLDRLAREGSRFTSFYVSSPVCSASRAALLTGCYHSRVGIHGALGPAARVGISDEETTLAEALKSRGYATGMVGKWHLGSEVRFLPTRHGFDAYFGLPYSNDMWPNHPTAKAGTYPPLPLLDGTNVVETMPDQRTLTRRYTDRAVRFVEANADRPFFLYFAHSMPHVPLHTADRFAGRTARGLYGDVIEEIDASVGELLDTLDRLRIADRTWVIFTSDNGPWLSYGEHAGRATPLREGKGTVFEGGIRVPCVMRWPGQIPAGAVCDVPLMTIDLFPTIVGRTGATGVPRQLPIDGRDVWPVLAGVPGARTDRDALFFYYGNNELQAMRSGRWKLHFPHTAAVLEGQPGGRGGTPVPYRSLAVGLELYDLQSDIGEQTNVVAQQVEVVSTLSRMADAIRADLGDSLTGRTGTGNRAPGRVAKAAAAAEPASP